MFAAPLFLSSPTASGGGPGYSPTFYDNGGTAFFDFATSAIADATTWEFCMDINWNALPSSNRVLLNMNGGANELRIRKDSSHKITIYCRNTAGTVIWDTDSVSTPFDVGKVYRLYVSFDGGSGTGQIYLNGVSVAVSDAVSATTGTAQLSDAGTLLDAINAGSIPDALIGDVFFESGHSLHGHSAFYNGGVVDFASLGSPDILLTGATNATGRNSYTNEGAITLSAGATGWT